MTMLPFSTNFYCYFGSVGKRISIKQHLSHISMKRKFSSTNEMNNILNEVRKQTKQSHSQEHTKLQKAYKTR